MTDRVDIHGLKAARSFHDFITREALPGTGIEADAFFRDLSAIAHELAPENRTLLAERDELQKKIDAWHRDNGAPGDMAVYEAFLREIGYLLPEGPDFSVTTRNVDPEIADVAGPQLVVPVMNARYALNAANARWGSLYDALYGTDAIPEDDGAEKGKGYNPVRGGKVIAWARSFLDESVPLDDCGWSDVTGIRVEDGRLVLHTEGTRCRLAEQGQFAGYRGSPAAPEAILLRRNGLHIEIVVDNEHPIGRDDRAGIADLVIESALTTIQDCEDSVAAVDAEDKVAVYRNWLGLMKGDLEEEIEKGGRRFTRSLNPDRRYTAPDGSQLSLPGRSLMLVRNVGHLMTNPAVLLDDGSEIPEGILDAMVTAAIALHDIGPGGRRMNSRAGSVYVVKPKMH